MSLEDDILSRGFYFSSRAVSETILAHATPCQREVYDLIVRRANYKDLPWGEKVIRRGQWRTTYQNIRDELHWWHGASKKRYSKKQIETALRWLERRGLIKRQKICRGLIITVCFYNAMQDMKNYTKRHGSNGSSAMGDTTYKRSIKNKDNTNQPASRDDSHEEFQRKFLDAKKKMEVSNDDEDRSAA